MYTTTMCWCNHLRILFIINLAFDGSCSSNSIISARRSTSSTNIERFLVAWLLILSFPIYIDRCGFAKQYIDQYVEYIQACNSVHDAWPAIQWLFKSVQKSSNSPTKECGAQIAERIGHTVNQSTNSGVPVLTHNRCEEESVIRLMEKSVEYDCYDYIIMSISQVYKRQHCNTRTWWWWWLIDRLVFD